MLVSIKYILMTTIAIFVLMSMFVHFSECLAENCVLPENTLQTAIFGTDYSVLVNWFSDTINFQEKNFEHNESTNQYKGMTDYRSYDLPQQLSGIGLRYDVPFALSNDNNFLIAAVYPDRMMLEPSKEVVLISLVDKEKIGSIKFKKSILSVLWSPTTSYVAVLLREKAQKTMIRALVDLPSEIFGHPISYYDLSVAIYDRDGKFICEKNISQKLQLGSGYLIGWQE